MTPLERKEVISSPARHRHRAPLWIITVLLLIIAVMAVALWRPWGDSAPASVPLDADSAVSSTSSRTIGTTPTSRTTRTTRTTEATVATTTSSTETNTSQTSSAPDAMPMYSVGNPEYTYRTVECYRDYNPSANVADDALAITGVKTPSSDGIYVIPDTIDGHPVYKVDELAFSDEAIRDTVKTVVFSASVHRVEDNAFAACHNLSDVYYCGNGIYISAFAYPEPADLSGTLTIHCSTDCHDYFFRYHKDQTVYAYEEWKGGALS